MDNSQFAVFEGMTSISSLIHGIESGVNDRKIKEIYFSNSKLKTKSSDYHFLKKQSLAMGFNINLVSDDVIDNLAQGNSHGGILAICSDRIIPELTSTSPLPETGFFAMLEGIEDPYNFGYSIRSLYASGLDGLVLSPRNWMSAAGLVAKSSAGTSEMLPVYQGEPDTLLNCFKNNNYRIVCAGIRDSVPSCQANLKRPILLVVGGEKRGISRNILKMSDETVRIEYGRKFNGSLTTSATAAILGFEVLKQNS